MCGTLYVVSDIEALEPKERAMTKTTRRGRKVVSVALRKDDMIYSLPRPARHHDVIHKIYDVIDRQVTSEYEQGFLDSEGMFMDRETAMVFAKKNNQIIRLPVMSETLYSEDLW